MWLWLWRRPAAAAPIRPLAWEPPYDVGEALKRQKEKKKKRKKEKIVLTLDAPETISRTPKGQGPSLGTTALVAIFRV